MTSTFHVREVHAAGGLDKWMAQQTRKANAAARAREQRRQAVTGCPTEHEEQVELFRRATAFSPSILALACLFAIPNGGHRHKAVAGRLRAEGVRAGIPDVFLAWPAQGRAGLFIELKRVKGGRVEPEQRQWAQRLTAAGYRCEVCRGADEAWRCIMDYLGVA